MCGNIGTPVRSRCFFTALNVVCMTSTTHFSHGAVRSSHANWFTLIWISADLNRVVISSLWIMRNFPGFLEKRPKFT
jgi:hypothetical protein